jgi:fucose 4-O-acetylase-like acetyltransferase
MKDKLNNRLDFIDVATGITMVLVVFGHNFFKEFQQDQFYAPLRVFIYQFHMSVFMFLSGFVVYYSFKQIDSFDQYVRYILKRIVKFLPPYLFLHLISILFDYLYGNIDNYQIVENLKYMLLAPANGSAGFLWYLYVLLFFYFITPLIKKINDRYFFILISITLFLTTIKLPQYFSMNLIGRYYFFFLIGGYFSDKISYIDKIVNNFNIYAIIFFIVMLINIYTINIHIPYQIISICAIIIVLYISSCLNNNKNIQNIGIYSWYIYLLNTFIVGAIYIIFKKAHLIEIIPSLLFIVPSTFMGLYVPILLNKFMCRVLKSGSRRPRVA